MQRDCAPTSSTFRASRRLARLLDAEPSLEAVERLVAELLEVVDAPARTSAAWSHARPRSSRRPTPRHVVVRRARAEPAREGVSDRPLPVVVNLSLTGKEGGGRSDERLLREQLFAVDHVLFERLFG